MTIVPLEVIFYLVIGFSVIFYTVLDGFDLGVGSLHLFARKDEYRRIFLNAIGPVWDGNEVWLVVIVGALLAGFPPAYASLLSGFYVLNMILIACLIFRAVAIEFRSKQKSTTWRSIWDVVFCVASFMIGFLIGVILGNLITGVPLNEQGDFVASFGSFFGPYQILVGITSVALFMMHGSIYLIMKTEGKLHLALRKWAVRCILFFVTCYSISTVATFLFQPHMVARMKEWPYLLVVLCAVLIIANIPREIYKGRDGFAFISSALAIALLVVIFGIGTFPNLIRSSINPEELSLTIFDASSSLLTLKVLLTIVLIGIPLVFAYGFYIYKVFRGKVRLGPMSY